MILAGLAAVLSLTALSAVPAAAATDRTGFTRWTSSTDFARGASNALVATSGAMALRPGQLYGTWTSPWVSTGYAAKAVIPSWNVSTPGGGWARFHMRVRCGT